jgi:5-methylcytosine-specific restriction endonuclease McrA|tara:strand:+ start:140 stop:733 length:594 start_codon:yes stop_codon:yes gene_type:complete
MYKKIKKIRPKLVDNPSSVVIQKLSNIDSKESTKFWASDDWKQLRDEFLDDVWQKLKKSLDTNKHKFFKCNYCDEDVSKSKNLNVDHIKPIKNYWNLRLDKNNLQILCKDCNKFKGNKEHGYTLKEDCIENKNILKKEIEEELEDEIVIENKELTLKSVAKELALGGFSKKMINVGTTPGWIRYQKRINFGKKKING